MTKKMERRKKMEEIADKDDKMKEKNLWTTIIDRKKNKTSEKENEKVTPQGIQQRK